jgi:hypothetical protein
MINEEGLNSWADLYEIPRRQSDESMAHYRKRIASFFNGVLVA